MGSKKQLLLFTKFYQNWYKFIYDNVIVNRDEQVMQYFLDGKDITLSDIKTRQGIVTINKENELKVNGEYVMSVDVTREVTLMDSFMQDEY